ncbi:hypothetical protein TWF128_001687 [Orbilia oligospora]|nr:hypothetical protein TWF128_001687 [Orbilia oligospora]
MSPPVAPIPVVTVAALLVPAPNATNVERLAILPATVNLETMEGSAEEIDTLLAVDKHVTLAADLVSFCSQIIKLRPIVKSNILILDFKATCLVTVHKARSATTVCLIEAYIPLLPPPFFPPVKDI